MANAGVATGPAMESEDERLHQRRLAETYADEAEKAVEVIEAKIAGITEALAAKKAEVKHWRAEAKRLAEGTD